MNFKSIKSRLENFLDKEMKKEFGTTDIEQAKEINKQRTSGYGFRGKRKEPDTVVDSEIVTDKDDEIIEGVIVED